MITILGYIGTVILLSTLLVVFILSRPERFNLDEESEALKPCKHQYIDGVTMDPTINPCCVKCGEFMIKDFVESKTKGDV